MKQPKTVGSLEKPPHLPTRQRQDGDAGGGPASLAQYYAYAEEYA